MKTVTDKQLNELLKNWQVTLIDVRTTEEFQLEHIQWAINLPLDDFEDYKDSLKKYENIICYCNTGNSSSQFCKRVEHAWYTNVANLSWWISWCKTCTKIKKKWALPMMQQVQIAAGIFVLLWIILAKAFHVYPWHEYFIWISAFVWAWLIFAWSTGRCWLAKLLAVLPRNKSDYTKKTTEILWNDLIIKQFEDSNLAHYSYMAISNWEAIVVDPERDPTKYYTYAKEHNATIIGVLNTHPHADFASWHLEIHHTTGATIYVGDKVWAEYPHTPLSWGERIAFWNASIVTYFTPGHSPDSMSYLVKDASQKSLWFFTGDWVFIWDVWRADLRENVGNIKAKQAELAGMMYESTRSLLPTIHPSTRILPAHGAWTSCGKWLSKINMDTLANQLKHNPMLQSMTKEEFISELTADQPAIPAYFTNSVLLNKKWNKNIEEAIHQVQFLDHLPEKDETVLIDTRSWELSVNYPLDKKTVVISHDNTNFTWMIGTIVHPSQKFIVIIEKKATVQKIIHDIVSIWYEDQLLWIYCIEDHGYHPYVITHKEFEKNNQVIILDVRSETAFKDNPIYDHAINIPIEKLTTEIDTLAKDTIYVPYCWWSYKSNIALSILLAHWFTAKKMYV